MNSKTRSDLILLLAAAIWGFAFVAQRLGMNYVGPFTYTAVRFALGAIVLIPFLFISRQDLGPLRLLGLLRFPTIPGRKKLILLQLILGLVLFGGISFQQYGLQYTTAGNAGFITGFYVVLVPVTGLFFGSRSNYRIWTGVVLAITGLYLLSVTKGFVVNTGDYYVAVCALFWTAHVLLVSYIAPRTDPVQTAVIQYLTCSALSFFVAAGFEEIRWQPIVDAAGPILYGGILSVAIAYTLQVVAQRKAHPAYASIILSLESVFAVFGGWLILDEHLTARSLAGCLLMLAGMVVVQLKAGPALKN